MTGVILNIDCYQFILQLSQIVILIFFESKQVLKTLINLLTSYRLNLRLKLDLNLILLYDINHLNLIIRSQVGI